MMDDDLRRELLALWWILVKVTLSAAALLCVGILLLALFV